MKRCIKGGFLVLGGVVGVVGMIIAAMQNPSVEWVTPTWKNDNKHFGKRIVDSYSFISCSHYLWIVYSIDRK